MKCIKVLISCVLIVVAFVLCFKLSFSAQVGDSWYRSPPPELSERGDWELLELSRLHEVLDSVEKSAESLLEGASCKPVTKTQVKKLLGHELPNNPKMQTYLVRSLYFNKATGGYYVSILNSDLWVHHASLGRGHALMKRKALVLQLEKAPKRIFVTCSLAE